jgi:hypothetical protein
VKLLRPAVMLVATSCMAPTQTTANRFGAALSYPRLRRHSMALLAVSAMVLNRQTRCICSVNSVNCDGLIDSPLCRGVAGSREGLR